MQRPKVMLGELMVEKGVITPDQLRIVLLEQKRTNVPIGKLLINSGFITEPVLQQMLGEALGQENVDLTKVVVDSEAVKVVSKEFALRYSILPIAFDKRLKRFTVAMTNTFDVVALDMLRGILGENTEIKALLAGESDIQNAIDRYYGFELSVNGILSELETGQIDHTSIDNALDSKNEYSQPIVRLVDSLIYDAVKRGASDIHFEPESGYLRIRYRVDGVLFLIHSLHNKYQSMITVRIKVLAELNIAESRVPQDGHFSLTLFGRSVHFRVSTFPITHGENVVLRILDQEKGILPLEDLGITDESLKTIRLMMARPEGIILISGPTGSGKTTTLYSMLHCINNDSINIMTMEDPVEYPMERIRQSNVNKAAKLTFARGIRSILRQDPDVILVGEIRDEETAEMAFRSAMTGHQVYSTVHANSALKAVGRLMDIGTPRDIIANNLIGIIGQRLVRKLCTYCRQPYDPTELERRLLNVENDVQLPVVYRAAKCSHCDYRGYSGRLCIIEILWVDDELESMIASGNSLQEIGKILLAKGFSSMAQDGIQRVLQGLTTLSEISRVVDMTARVRDYRERRH